MIESEAAARHWINQLPEFDSAALERLERLVTMLGLENRRQNLVSAASLDHVWQRHIVDSAQLLTHVPRGTGCWLDLGTGAGFPGIVVAALRPECPVVLVESRKRRCEWLRSLIDLLELRSASVAESRLEQLESFDAAVISARAFAPLDRLLALSARFSTKATTWLLPKGRSARQELDELRGWQHTFHVEPSITDPHAGIIAGHLIGSKEKRA